MKLGHFSDLHGDLTSLLTSTETPDVWVCTGDFFPNAPRPIVPSEQVEYQTTWFHSHSAELKARFAGKPVLFLGGNHDFVNLAELLTNSGYLTAHKVGMDGVTVDGVRFAGFPEIRYIKGEWKGEVTNTDLAVLVVELFGNPPDVLLTHAPPAGILDSVDDSYVGIGPLTSALSYTPHNVRAHLFGHGHDQGGQTTEEMGIRFYNGALHVRFIEV